MKKLFLALFLLGGLVTFIACEQDLMSDAGLVEFEESEDLMGAALTRSVMPSYMPLNYVPEWVREKTTEEEYELWVIMSSKFEICYSFMEEELSDEQKNHIYEGVRKICEDIQNGIITEPMGTIYFLNVSNMENNQITRIQTRSESSPSKKQTITVYSKNGIVVYVGLSYEYNSNTNTLSNVTITKPYANTGLLYGQSQVTTTSGNCMYITAMGTVGYEEYGVKKTESFEYRNSIYPY